MPTYGDLRQAGQSWPSPGVSPAFLPFASMADGSDLDNDSAGDTSTYFEYGHQGNGALPRFVLDAAFDLCTPQIVGGFQATYTGLNSPLPPGTDSVYPSEIQRFISDDGISWQLAGYDNLIDFLTGDVQTVDSLSGAGLLHGGMNPVGDLLTQAARWHGVRINGGGTSGFEEPQPDAAFRLFDVRLYDQAETLMARGAACAGGGGCVHPAPPVLYATPLLIGSPATPIIRLTGM